MTTEPSQADIMAALQAGSFRSKAPASSSLYADISDPVNSLTQGEGSSKTNSRKIYCFREGCGSVILQKGAATYLESSSTIVTILPLLETSELIDRSQMTPHPLSLPPQATPMPSGMCLIHMHSTISDSQDRIPLQLSLYQTTYQGMMEKKGRVKRLNG
jgi:hypothetical protein